MNRCLWRLVLTGVIAVSMVGGPLACAGRDGDLRTRTKSPEDLRDAYRRALEKDDPKAVYALLSPQLQAEIDEEAFVERWNAHAAERAAALAALDGLEGEPATTATGTTAHANGAIVRWVEVDGQFMVVEGLPGLPDRSTPSATVRAFIAASRALDRSAVAALLGDELRDRTVEALAARAEALEAALRQPGAFDFEQGRTRAILRFGEPTLTPGQTAERKLVLERDDGGWRIIGVQ